MNESAPLQRLRNIFAATCLTLPLLLHGQVGKAQDTDVLIKRVFIERGPHGYPNLDFLPRLSTEDKRKLLPAIKERLTNQDPILRFVAVRSARLISPVSKPLIPNLLERRKDSVPMVRHEAALALARLAAIDKTLLPHLIKALPFNNVAEEIGIYSGKALLPELMALVKTSGPEVPRDALMRIFSAMGPDARPAVPLLIEEVRKGQNFYSQQKYGSVEAVNALAGMGPASQDAVPDLLVLLWRMLGDESRRQVANDIADNIERIGIAGVPALEAALCDDSETLVKGPSAFQELAAGFKRDPSARSSWARLVTNVLGAMGPAGIAPLKRAQKNGDDFLHYSAGLGLQRIGPAAGEIPRDYDYIKLPDLDVPALIAKLSDDDPYVRRAVYIRLGRIGRHAAPAIPALLQNLKTEMEADRRRMYVQETLSYIGPAVIEPLTPLLNDDHWEIRMAALRTLERIGTPAALKVRERFLQNGYRLAP